MVDKNALDRHQSIEYKEKGRNNVQLFGERLSKYNEWDWHLLGQAIECYIDAIKHDENHQHPWTNLAYVFHLIGEREQADQCMKKSYLLASPGPRYPGRNYKKVKSAIDSNRFLSGGMLVRQETPEWFREKYSEFLS